MSTQALLLFLFVFACGPARADADALREAVQAVAAQASPVADAGRLLDPAEVASLVELAGQMRQRGLRARFVTAPRDVPADRFLAALGDSLAPGPEDILIVCGERGAYTRAPALKGQGADLTRALELARPRFAAGRGEGIADLARRVAELVETRRAREGALSNAGSLAISLIVLGLAAGLIWRMRAARLERAAAEASHLAGSADRCAGKLFELGAATEDGPGEAHALYLDGWRRFGLARQSAGLARFAGQSGQGRPPYSPGLAAGLAEFEQLGLFLDEALRRVRGGE